MLQNHKNCLAAGGSGPRLPSTVTIYLMTMPPFVTRLRSLNQAIFVQKIYFLFTPLSKILVACLVVFTAVDGFFRRLWAADETSQETLPVLQVFLFLDMITESLELRILEAVQGLKISFCMQKFSLF